MEGGSVVAKIVSREGLGKLTANERGIYKNATDHKGGWGGGGGGMDR